MRILSLVDEISGGGGMVMYNLIRGLSNHQHLIVCPALVHSWSIGLPKLIKEAKIPIKMTGGNSPRVAIRLVEKEVMAFDPDIIINHWWASARIQRLNKFGKTRKVYGRAKTILVSHNNDPSPPGYDYYISVSKHNAKFQMHAKRKNHKVIYNGIDINKFNIPKNPIPNKFVIGRVSSLVRFKAPRRWIYFANSFDIPNVLHYIVGEGERRKQFLSDIAALGVQHRFVLPGQLSQEKDEVSKTLSQFDIVCYVTKKTEAFSLAMLEAMAAGLPIVTQNAGGMPEQIVHGKTGFLCNNRAEIRQYCEKLAKDSKLVRDMGKAAKERVQQFTIANMAEQYEQVFDELTNG